MTLKANRNAPEELSGGGVESEGGADGKCVLRVAEGDVVSGTQTEPFRLKADARAALLFDNWQIYVSVQNLTNQGGRSFYFKSVGNEFFAQTKPRIIMTGITIKL